MKQIALILTLLLAAAGASAQEVFIGADFDTRFDNREHSDCNIDDSHTFFSMRLTPKAGVIWSEKNRLVVAVDLLQDFGDKEHKFLSKVDPQIYYQFNSKTAQAVAGIFPRSLLLARRLLPQAPSHKLGALIEFTRLPVAGRYHRALADAEMAASLLLRLEAELIARHQMAEVSHALLRTIQAAPKHQLERCLARHRQAAPADA